jgi:hypothetical protein
MHRPLRKSVHAIAALLVCLGATGAVRAQQSADYVADRTTLAGVAGRATSAGYVLELTAAEIHPAGSASACNIGFTDSIGFWSVLGDALVPIVLQVGHDPGNHSIAQLTWSGASPQFAVLRSEAASGIIDPMNLLLTTAGCDAADPDPPPGGAFFYVVVPADSLEASP